MKKVFALITTLLVASLALAGCGGTNQSSSSGSSAVAQNASGMKTLKVGATAVPHAEILEVVKPLLEKDGIKLEIVEFNDYVQPNLALNDKELDANFFQHEPYLKNFMEEHKEVKLKNAFGVHIEPMGIYSKKVKDLKELKDGASIVLTASTTSVKGTPAFSVYSATKAAVRNFARSWILDLKPRRIRVNAVSPGLTDTAGLNELFGGGDQAEGTKSWLSEQVPSGRIGQPSEVASAITFLASDDASYINGIELFVDGGLAQI